METQSNLTANYYIEEYSILCGWSAIKEYKTGKVRYFPNQEKAYTYKIKELNRKDKYRLMRKLPNGFKEIVKRWYE